MNVSFKGLSNSSYYSALISDTSTRNEAEARFFFINRLTTQVNNKGGNDLDFFEPVLKDFPDLENNKNFLIFDMIDELSFSGETADKLKTPIVHEDLPIVGTKFFLNGKQLRTEYNECFNFPERTEEMSKLYKKDLSVLDKIAVLAKKMSTMKFFPKTSDYYRSDEIFQNTFGAMKMFCSPKEYELRIEKFKRSDEVMDLIKCYHHPKFVAGHASKIVEGMTSAVMKSLT